MGIRSIEKQSAKGRMKAMGIGNINKKMSNSKIENGKRIQLWKAVLNGKYAKQALAAQLSSGIKSRRKLKKVSS